MNILYIGGTGEISYSCIHRGAALGQKISVYNRGSSTDPLPTSVERVIGDVNDESTYRRLGQRQWDVVCQFRAFKLADVQRDLEVFAGRTGQYVFISSASGYLKPPRGYVITEDVPMVNPYWPYSAAKAQMEAFLLDAHRQGKLPVTIVRPSHTYRRNFTCAIGGGDLVAWRMLNNKPVIVHGDGTSLWTVTYCEDFAAPFVGLLGHPRALGEAFHITTHMQAYTWNDITRIIGRTLGVEPNIVHVPTETLIRYNAEWRGPLLGDKTWPVLYDNSKVMSVAGPFKTTVPLEEGARRVAALYHKRAGASTPDAKANALFDRIAAEQAGLGTSL